VTEGIVNHVSDEMASFPFEMGARSGREIEAAYTKRDSLTKRMAALDEKRPITHIYSQPFEAEYTQAQLSFPWSNPWFLPQKVPGETHFPALEPPELVSRLIADFVGQAG
jgi:pimeloyl-ACP methyl ester carboxylesterase